MSVCRRGATNQSKRSDALSRHPTIDPATVDLSAPVGAFDVPLPELDGFSPTPQPKGETWPLMRPGAGTFGTANITLTLPDARARKLVKLPGGTFYYERTCDTREEEDRLLVDYEKFQARCARARKGAATRAKRAATAPKPDAA